MILSNYWAWCKDITSQQTSGTVAVNNITAINGGAITGFSATNEHCRVIYYNNTYFKLLFGSGTTAPTANDYCLETDESTNLTVVQNVVVSYATNKFELIITSTITNTSANDITINEIGAAKSFNGTAGDANWFLLVREVLDTPVIIPAGETKILNYTWTMQ